MSLLEVVERLRREEHLIDKRSGLRVDGTTLKGSRVTVQSLVRQELAPKEMGDSGTYGF